MALKYRDRGVDGREYRNVIITQIIEDGADCYPWRETFVIWPRRSVSGAPLFWTKAYKRKVWAVWGSGFHMEPLVQYATLFDILSGQAEILER